mmetsp:Transcript_4666/g.7065  ORF Transcript_4666/g.7065 Transcript_4666/m.7065 type:complete len:117 (+) Transcript_4666:843-1193(+)
MDQAKLFKLFGLVSNLERKDNTQGIGLGLYISKQIATQFKGDISVESEVRKGSTFSFNFQLDQENVRKQSRSRSTMRRVQKMFKKKSSIWDQLRPMIKSNVLAKDSKLNLCQDLPQ